MKKLITICLVLSVLVIVLLIIRKNISNQQSNQLITKSRAEPTPTPIFRFNNCPITNAILNGDSSELYLMYNTNIGGKDYKLLQYCPSEDFSDRIGPEILQIFIKNNTNRKQEEVRFLQILRQEGFEPNENLEVQFFAIEEFTKVVKQVDNLVYSRWTQVK